MSAMTQVDSSASGNMVENMTDAESQSIFLPNAYMNDTNPPEFFGIETLPEPTADEIKSMAANLSHKKYDFSEKSGKL